MFCKGRIFVAFDLFSSKCQEVFSLFHTQVFLDILIIIAFLGQTIASCKFPIFTKNVHI